jgi:hypothetical protein
METTQRYHRHRMSACLVVSTGPLFKLMRSRRKKAAYTRKLYQGDLSAVHHHIVLVLVPIPEEDGIELEDAVSLLAREQEPHYGLAIVLLRQRQRVRPMVHVRLDAHVPVARRQYVFLAVKL